MLLAQESSMACGNSVQTHHFLREGHVVEEGHHDDLLAHGGTYADLWHLQSGELREEEAIR